MLHWSPAISPPLPSLLRFSLRVYRAELFSPAAVMGRRKFRLSDMIPNAWFYKLRDMRMAGSGRGRGRGAMPHQQSSSSSRGERAAVVFQQQPPSPWNRAEVFPHRASYYYTTRDREVVVKPPPPLLRVPKPAEFVPLALSPPRNSRRRHRVSPVRTGRQQHASEDIGFVPPPSPVLSPALDPVVVDALGTSSRRRRDMYVEYDGGELRRPTVIVPEDDGQLHGEVISSKKDIVIDLRGEGMPERVLRPIVTKPVRRQPDPHEFQDRHVVVELADMTPRPSSASEKSCSTGNKPRRSSVSSPGLRLKTRSNSPRLAAATARKSTATAARKSTRPVPAPAPAPALADSFAVVKSSDHPRRDFRESMEEMIAVKGIRDGADLEDLLACYLSLNAAEYHDLIVEVFKQIWTSLAKDVRP